MCPCQNVWCPLCREFPQFYILSYGGLWTVQYQSRVTVRHMVHRRFIPSGVLQHATFTLTAAGSGRSAPSLWSPLPTTKINKNMHQSSNSATEQRMFTTSFLLYFVILLDISSTWNLEFFILPDVLLERLRWTYVAFDTAKRHVQTDLLLKQQGTYKSARSAAQHQFCHSFLNDPCPLPF